ncbi:HNH endonuclease [Streptomyces pluripotens]|uniref:HNH endonuclease n=1 Tax=Streptomyces pluripotens TaxID=1355015 RepID=A0A221P1G3_9ACTN|nr:MULTISPECIES: HNH endonuclease family protein [Streptomyces]ARP71821.1 hypothetical protein LK06_019810 [Streptomyces pluripotens]ASN26071.1 HNH endonuclease [Streptomyces pluripotens]KIE26235.1 lipoprotein [Streptomyces sp. MUSC 125]MCH0556297.1 HNH endonuclease [Streptomyces sp. MUM 16J]
MARLGGGVVAAVIVLIAGAGCKAGQTEGSSGTRSAGEALTAAGSLTVKGRAPKTGYSRARFGTPWADTDSNSCDTRDDILKRDLKNVRFTGGTCKVSYGLLDRDPYSDKAITYRRGRSQVDIDHVVALSDAWQKGAKYWDPSKRIALANDPLNLIAVDAGANRGKGDGDAATWLPSNKAYRCTYVATQVAVKKKYGLWVTAAERTAMKQVLATCPDQKLPTGGNPTRAPERFRAR